MATFHQHSEAMVGRIEAMYQDGYLPVWREEWEALQEEVFRLGLPVPVDEKYYTYPVIRRNVALQQGNVEANLSLRGLIDARSNASNALQRISWLHHEEHARRLPGAVMLTRQVIEDTRAFRLVISIPGHAVNRWRCWGYMPPAHLRRSEVRQRVRDGAAEAVDYYEEKTTQKIATISGMISLLADGYSGWYEPRGSSGDSA